jgi:hypothetical protein
LHKLQDGPVGLLTGKSSDLLARDAVRGLLLGFDADPMSELSS